MRKEKELRKIIIHSGGAVGADYEWAKNALEKDSCYFVVNHSFYSHVPKIDGLDYHRLHNRIHCIEELQHEAMQHIQIASNNMNRPIPSKNFYTQALVLRDWYQVEKSEAVFAVSTLNKEETNVVGGTAWAIECAKAKGLFILVFDQNKEHWYFFKYKENKFVQCEKDAPEGFIRQKDFKNITCIGTRNINQIGIKAIKNIL